MKAPRFILIVLYLTILYTSLSKDVPVNIQSTEEAIINLNEQNFEQLVDLGRSERWFIMFHSGCSSCQEVYPAWNNFTKSRRGIRLGSVNGTAYPVLANRYGIREFPTFIFFDEGKIETYNGENTVQAWNDFISQKKGAGNVNQTTPDAASQEDPIVELDRNSFDNFVLAPMARPWFIMFHTHCPECEAAFPSWHEFARTIKDGPNIGMVDCDKNPELSQKFDIKTHPTFIYFEDGEAQIFNGERKVKEWTQYVAQKQNKDLAADTQVENITNNTTTNVEILNPPNPAPETPNPVPETPETPALQNPASEEPNTGDAVVELTQGNFDALVNSKDSGPWFIMFHAPWCPHCQRALPTWKEFGNTKRSGVKVGTVDCVAHPELAGRNNIQGFPTFIYFNEGKSEVFNGERSVEAWSQFVDLKKNNGITEAPAPESIESSDDATIQLTKENFDSLVNSADSGSWFIMFYAPWCPHCQRAAPTWRELARTKKEGARIGMVNCVEQPELQGRFGISGFPTFMFFKQGKTEIFNGPRTVEAWSQFIDLNKPSQPSEASLSQAGEFERPTNKADEIRTGEQFAVPAAASNPEAPQDRPISEPAERLPEPAIGNLNALNATVGAQNTTIPEPGLPRNPQGSIESSIKDLPGLNGTAGVREAPLLITYEQTAAGATETRPGVTVETMNDRPNEGRLDDTTTTTHYKEPMLVIGVVAVLLLGSFFLFTCYQQLRGKYTAIDTTDRDIEAAPGDSSSIKRDSFSNSMRFDSKI